MASPDLLGLPLELREHILEYVMLPKLTVGMDEGIIPYGLYWKRNLRRRQYHRTTPEVHTQQCLEQRQTELRVYRAMTMNDLEGHRTGGQGGSRTRTPTTRWSSGQTSPCL